MREVRKEDREECTREREREREARAERGDKWEERGGEEVRREDKIIEVWNYSIYWHDLWVSFSSYNPLWYPRGGWDEL